MREDFVKFFGSDSMEGANKSGKEEKDQKELTKLVEKLSVKNLKKSKNKLIELLNSIKERRQDIQKSAVLNENEEMKENVV